MCVCERENEIKARERGRMKKFKRVNVNESRTVSDIDGGNWITTRKYQDRKRIILARK